MNQLKVNITGNIKYIAVEKGEKVTKGQPIILIESMQMEIPVNTTKDGTVDEILVREGDFVIEGNTIAHIN